MALGAEPPLASRHFSSTLNAETTRLMISADGMRRTISPSSASNLKKANSPSGDAFTDPTEFTAASVMRFPSWLPPATGEIDEIRGAFLAVNGPAFAEQVAKEVFGLGALGWIELSP